MISHHAAQVNVRVSIDDPVGRRAHQHPRHPRRSSAPPGRPAIRTLPLRFERRHGLRRAAGLPLRRGALRCARPSPYGCAKLAVELYLDAFRVDAATSTRSSSATPTSTARARSPRARPGSSRSSPRSSSPARRRGSSTTASRRATTSTSATWSPRTAPRSSAGRRASTTSAPASRPRSTRSTRWSRGKLGSTIRPRHEPPVAAELRRNALDAGRLERALGAAPRTRTRTRGSTLTLPYYVERARGGLARDDGCPSSSRRSRQPSPPSYDAERPWTLLDDVARRASRGAALGGDRRPRAPRRPSRRRPDRASARARASRPGAIARRPALDRRGRRDPRRRLPARRLLGGRRLRRRRQRRDEARHPPPRRARART